MELNARGWGRNMGNTTIADIDLGELKVRREPNKPVHFDDPGLSPWVGQNPPGMVT